MSFVLALALLGAAVVQASPHLVGRQSITALSTAQINTYTPYTWYASAAHCPASLTIGWTCGSSCAANPNFQPVAAGGDGDAVQYWYVGYDPNLQTVIVGHQGTNTSELLPIITDANFFLTNLDSTLFPGLSSNIEVHNGFGSEQASTATEILAAVEQTMSEYGATSVTMVGHSLGAALALLDSVYLPLWLPAGTTFQTFGYGLPRVGNQAFADYVDANVYLTHINNREDPVPICPGMFMDFVHPSGEIHIQDSGEWASCPGQDNPSTQCIVGDVPYIWDGSTGDHGGPYNGIVMGCN